MLLNRPLAVVTPTLDGDVLAALAAVDASFTTGQLNRLLPPHSYSGIRKTLLRLVEQGIVHTETVGNAHVYRLNRDHLAADAIRGLAGMRGRFLETLRSLLSTWPVPATYASLFGSAARGDMRPASDIDVFLVRPDRVDVEEESYRLWRSSSAHLADRATRLTGNDTRILELGEHEVGQNLRKRGDPVLEEIRRDEIRLYGDRSFWRKANRG